MAGIKVLQQILFLIVIIAIAITYIRYIERKTIFFPSGEIEYTPKELGLEFEEVFFKTKDNLELHGWFLPRQSAQYSLLFCHGNAGNISHRIEKLRFFHDLGLNIFIFDYRGYGKSKGRPSEKGLYRDTKAAYVYLLSRNIKPEQIIGYGESLGGAVIIDLASHNKLYALIIDSTMSNAKDMAKIIYPFLPHWIISTKLDSLSKVKTIKIPKLFIHSINDEIVPYKLGKKLFAAASEPKEFLEIRGGHNSNFFECGGILKESITDFIKRLNR